MRRHGRHNLLNVFTATTGSSLSLYLLFAHRDDFAIAAASLFLALACYTDGRHRKVPNLLTGLLVLTGFGVQTYVAGVGGALAALYGLALGIALLLLPYLMGGFGAGDVKLLGALGALLGPQPLLHVFVYSAFFGGGLALLYNLAAADPGRLLRSGWLSVKATAVTGDVRNLAPEGGLKRDYVRFPYAAAFAFGFFTYVVRGGVL